MTLEETGKSAKKASREIALLGTDKKNEALLKIAEMLVSESKKILEANKADMEAAKEAGIRASILDRLALDEKRIRSMADGVASVASLPDPIGEGIGSTVRPNGLMLLVR